MICLTVNAVLLFVHFKYNYIYANIVCVIVILGNWKINTLKACVNGYVYSERYRLLNVWGPFNNRYVAVPPGKAFNDIAFVCKFLYYECRSKDLGINYQWGNTMNKNVIFDIGKDEDKIFETLMSFVDFLYFRINIFLWTYLSISLTTVNLHFAVKNNFICQFVFRIIINV